ncbi:hypothetical protein DHEL01_v203938 [Diaporthe helianthi]|uniref:Uncharacterized protein n=1 Tax=Diaporthe helianthi TaxID=158607 RepID=A0A2P5I5A5_DIAHE|nr:hypothetical protein DHEL01_v203938 [Diaporthe helianthi]
MAFAQAQNVSHFEAVPLELHFKVLSLMSGPEDVLSTIRASPAVLRALQTGRERIYMAVLQTRLAPEVFREFLAILNAPDHNTGPSVGPLQTDEESEEHLEDWLAWHWEASQFLRSHAWGAIYPAPSLKQNPTEFKSHTRFMIRLYFCLSRLVNSFLPVARSTLNGTRINLPPTRQPISEWPPLADIELLRLQRGLLRHELCCRLIGIPSIAAHCGPRVYEGVSDSQPAGRDFLGPLIPLLPVDEREEVICASEFAKCPYSSLRSAWYEDLEEAILSRGRGRGRDAEVRHEDDGGSREENQKTLRHWLPDHYLAVSSGRPGRIAWPQQGVFGARLEVKSLRQRGWVFFEDQSRLRSLLGLPDANTSTIYYRDLKADCILHDFAVQFSDSALATRFTEDEGDEFFENYLHNNTGPSITFCTINAPSLRSTF